VQQSNGKSESNAVYKNSFIATPALSDFPKALLIFIPALLYPPILFTDKISGALRIGLFIFLVAYFFLASKRVSKNDVIIFLLLLLFSASLVSVNFDNLDGLRASGSTMLTVVFAWAMSRAVKENVRYKNLLINFYINFFKVVPISSLLSVIFLVTAGELNLFNVYLEGYDYWFTPFGAVFAKDFLGVSVYRSFSFFHEPVYLALFYAVNVFLISPSLKEKSKVFFIVNVVGGILTFSYLFFILSLILIFSIKITKISIKEYSYLLLVAVGLIILDSQINLFSSSSLSDRWERANFFFNAMEDANILQLMFGHGLALETGFDRGFSAGLFTTIYEVGIVNLIIIFIFIFVLKMPSKKFYIFLVLCTALLVFEPTKLPLFWILVIVLTVFERLEGPHKRLGKVD
jgi:hypothetical protein